jgi:hypothetical protein
VSNVFGVSLAFDEAGDPHVAYLGGGSDESLFWLQSDAALARRTGAGWSTEVLVRTGGEAASGVETSDFGNVVGLWPALVAGPEGFLLAYRDAHGGQFPTDWGHADIEVVEGRVGAWGAPKVAVLGGNTLEGHGAMTGAVLTPDGPALVWSAQPGGPTDTARDLWFARRTGEAWSEPVKLRAVGDTSWGPSFAWSSASGFGIAYEDRGRGVLSFLASVDGESWLAPEPIFGSGTGGWQPGLAFDPEGEPAIVHYVCSTVSSASVCRAEDDALVVQRRRNGRWPIVPTVVDPEGGRGPRLVFAGGKMVIAYKDLSGEGPTPRALKLAVQR